jgi:glutathione S-transferase
MSAQPVHYGSPHSQFTYKVALMLRLAGEPFSFRYIRFQKAMHRTQEFRRCRHGERSRS